MFQWSNALKIKGPGEPGPFILFGGGGGSRTRVREQTHRSLYMLSLCFFLVGEHARRQAHSPTSPSALALLPRAGRGRPAHLYNASPSPVSGARAAWLLVRQPVPVDRWQLCVSHRFYEGDGTSACHLYQPCPRRNRFAPLAAAGRR